VAAHPTRRVVITAAATLPLAVASGCGGVDVLSAPPRPAPDVALLRSAIAAEQLMVARYTNVLNAARNPGGATPAARRGGSPTALAAALEPVLAEHRAHLVQLRSRLIVPAGAAPSPSERAPAAPAAPTAPAAAVAFLRESEQAAATAMLDRLPQAPGSLAQLFASISASEATHVPVLDALLLDTGETSG
jgi:Ferritin-like domain